MRSTILLGNMILIAICAASYPLISAEIASVLLLLHATQSIINTYLATKTASQEGPYVTVVQFSILFWYSLPMLYNNLINDGICRLDDEFPDCSKAENILILLILLNLFSLILTLISKIFKFRVDDKFEQSGKKILSDRKSNLFVLLFASLSTAYILGVIGLDTFAIEVLSSRSINYETSNTGDGKSFINVALFSLYIGLLMAALKHLIFDQNKSAKRTLGILFLTLVLFLLAASSGNRSLLGLFLGSFLLYSFLRNKRKISGSVITSIIIFLLLATSLDLYRTYGLYNFDITKLSTDLLIRSIDFSSESLVAISAFNTPFYSMRESLIYQFLTYPVPRFLFDAKPIPEAIALYTNYRWGLNLLDISGNVMPGIIGQAYISGLLFNFIEISAILICIWKIMPITLKAVGYSNFVFLRVIFLVILFLSFRNFSMPLLFSIVFYAAGFAFTNIFLFHKKRETRGLINRNIINYTQK